MREWKADLVRIWIPLIAGAALLVGMFGGHWCPGKTGYQSRKLF
jgi:uncharacterized protein YneF (UPF0154 family)